MRGDGVAGSGVFGFLEGAGRGERGKGKEGREEEEEKKGEEANEE